MRSVLSQRRWMALGVGILVLAVGLFVIVSPLQRDQSTGSVLRANESTGLEDGGNPLGMQAQSSSGDEVRGGVGPASYGTTVSDSAEPDAGGVGLGLVAADDASLSDSAALDFGTAEPPAPHGGPGDVASVQDTADLVVRDAEGNIKRQETVK